MVFAEGFLLELRSGGSIRKSFLGNGSWHGSGRLDAIHFTGNELEMRVVKSGAAVVGDGDPAVQIGVLVVAGDGKHVVGIPGKIVREIRSFNLLFLRPIIFERHEQRGTIVKI